MNKAQVGTVVRWLGSPYTIVKIEGNGAILKQNFSIGTILAKPVPLGELKF